MPLEAKDIHKSYGGREVVRGVSFQVAPGEVVGLLGPNGAGKTTAFYTVIGLVKPDTGNIRLRGHDVTRLPMYQRARKGIGYLPQEASVFRKLTVRQNLDAVLEHQPLSVADRMRRRDALLEEFGLDHLRGEKAYTLSGGERRRVEIARALASGPRHLLLDEPFAGIDPIAVSEIQGIIMRLKEQGLGVLITDHNVRETLQITDRAYIISAGEILESGPPRQIAESPRVRSIYLGERFAL